MPCGLTKDGRLTPRSEFVIPRLKGDSSQGFRGLKSGKTYLEAALTYIGKEISAKDIIEKLSVDDQAHTSTSMIDSFVKSLEDFKIGNVIQINYHDQGFSLILKRRSPRVDSHSKLP
jgi:hypothetical protein